MVSATTENNRDFHIRPFQILHSVANILQSPVLLYPKCSLRDTWFTLFGLLQVVITISVLWHVGVGGCVPPPCEDFCKGCNVIIITHF